MNGAQRVILLIAALFFRRNAALSALSPHRERSCDQPGLSLDFLAASGLNCQCWNASHSMADSAYSYGPRLLHRQDRPTDLIVFLTLKST